MIPESRITSLPVNVSKMMTEAGGLDNYLANNPQAMEEMERAMKEEERRRERDRAVIAAMHIEAKRVERDRALRAATTLEMKIVTSLPPPVASSASTSTAADGVATGKARAASACEAPVVDRQYARLLDPPVNGTPMQERQAIGALAPPVGVAVGTDECDSTTSIGDQNFSSNQPKRYQRSETVDIASVFEQVKVAEQKISEEETHERTDSNLSDLLEGLKRDMSRGSIGAGGGGTPDHDSEIVIPKENIARPDDGDDLNQFIGIMLDELQSRDAEENDQSNMKVDVLSQSVQGGNTGDNRDDNDAEETTTIKHEEKYCQESSASLDDEVEDSDEPEAESNIAARSSSKEAASDSNDKLEMSNTANDNETSIVAVESEGESGPRQPRVRKKAHAAQAREIREAAMRELVSIALWKNRCVEDVCHSDWNRNRWRTKTLSLQKRCIVRLGRRQQVTMMMMMEVEKKIRRKHLTEFHRVWHVVALS